MAWKAGEIKRRKVTFDHTKVPGDLTDFVSFVDFTAYHTGQDIFVTKADGVTEIPREVLSGKVYSKYAGTFSSSLDTEVYFYYASGAADYAAAATYGRNNVWTNFEMVLHLIEAAAGTGTAGLYIDSSGNSNDGDDYVSATGKTGKVTDGQAFDGSNDYIGLPSAGMQGLSQGTVLFWVYPNNTTNGAILNHGASSGTINIAIIEIFGGRGGVFQLREFLRQGSTVRRDIHANYSIPTGAWSHCAVSVDGSGLTMYVDGVSRTMVTYAGSTANPQFYSSLGTAANHTRVGVHRYGGVDYRWLNGNLDELWVSKSALSGNYIQALFNNQNSPGTFYTIGAEETPPTGAKRQRTSTWI